MFVGSGQNADRYRFGFFYYRAACADAESIEIDLSGTYRDTIRSTIVSITGRAYSLHGMHVRPFSSPIRSTAHLNTEMKILIVEDEPKTRTYLKQGLVEAGFVCDIAADGVTGLHQLQTEAYDLAILDVMLPGKSGWSIVEELRKTHRTPVLFLTARDDDRVKGLELGGDDYLVKPFDFVELLARVRSLLRRGQTLDASVLRVGDLELDLMRRKAKRQGRTILLTAKEFALLWLLMRREGEILTRSLIASQVWDINFESDTNIVDAAIRRVRAKVDDPYEPKLIHTVRGMGYVLEQRDDSLV
jgi:two-component system, OmpR family, copper resistance phosphate regulon response regulator CusR